MVDEQKLRDLVSQGIVTTTEDGIRVVDASRLDGNLSQKKPKRNKTRPQETVPAPEPIVEEPTERRVLLPSDLQKKEHLDEHFEKKEFTMSETDAPKGVGLDVGTSFLVTGRFGSDGKIHFKKMRDCFLELEPKSPINKKFIQKGLDDRKAPYLEKNDCFYVLGEDAFLMANERHVNTRRPMHRGVLSPTEKEAFPILKELIGRLVGKPRVENERLVFSVPAKPIDADFDQLFHQDMIRSFIKTLGFDPHPMNEAEALAYSELLDSGLTGIAISCGAGMMNVAVLSSGDPVVTFSTSKSGDWVDQQAAIATNMTNSIIQQEKEGPDIDLMHPTAGNQLHAAISVYYGNLLVYTLEQIAYDLSRSPALPKFSEPIPLVVAGGTSLPTGFIEKFEQ
ncbi:MAG: rod shape-determining protein, partial [Nitrososphaera sp.]|nr:rod shape-determining protein [Nitrososphaera sp.]